MGVPVQLMFPKLLPCLCDPTVITDSIFHTFKGSLAPDACTKEVHALFLNFPMHGIGLFFVFLQGKHLVTF